MPRAPQPKDETAASRKETAHTGQGHATLRSLEITPDLMRALRPWVDLEETGPEGLRIWLLSLPPLLPPKGAPGQGPPGRAKEERVAELARALAECAGDRARTHFQAAEYFRENQALARRVRALEAMVGLRAEGARKAPASKEDTEAEEAVLRYLPKGRS